MRQTTKLLMIGLFCIFLFGRGILLCEGSQRLLIVGESFPPFEFEQSGKAVGLDVDIASAIFKKMGIDFEIRIMPWSQAWKLIEQGRADACFSTSRKEARMPYLIYPKEDMWTSEYVFFVRKDRMMPSFSGYADARGLLVGIVEGNSYHDEFWKARLKTESGRDVGVNFRKLSRGMIDLTPVDKTVGLYTLKLLKLGDTISYYETVLFSKGYPMPFAKKSTYPRIKEIATRFEQELTALKKSGEYAQIQDRWLK